jgi:hypothetical protein
MRDFLIVGFSSQNSDTWITNFRWGALHVVYSLWTPKITLICDAQYPTKWHNFRVIKLPLELKACPLLYVTDTLTGLHYRTQRYMQVFAIAERIKPTKITDFSWSLLIYPKTFSLFVKYISVHFKGLFLILQRIVWHEYFVRHFQILWANSFKETLPFAIVFISNSLSAVYLTEIEIYFMILQLTIFRCIY